MKSPGFMNRWPLVLALVAGAGPACQSDHPSDTDIAQQLTAELRAATTLNAAMAANSRHVHPVFNCVERVGRNEFRAHFGYSSDAAQAVSIPVGFFNRFWPPPIGRGQPTAFAPGSQGDVVQVRFNGNAVVAWVLGTDFEIATRRSRACALGGMGGASGTGGAGTGGVLGTGGTGTGGTGTGGQAMGGHGAGGGGVGGTDTGGLETGGSGTGGSSPTCPPAGCDDHNPCTIDLCNASTGFECSNINAPDNTSCSDGNACTTDDVCLSGVCTAGAPKNCSAADHCHAVGVCDPTSGACSDPTAPNGTSCSDNNACTSTDSCQGGLCVGGTPTVCQPSDQCHVTGVCEPATGVCSNPAAANGATCTDGDACTMGDSCQAGACAPGAPKVCVVSGVCHVAGICDIASGLCSDQIAPNGSPCDDGDACTAPDACVGGLCAGTAVANCGAEPPPCDRCTAANCVPATDGCDLIADPADKALCQNAYACFAADTHPGSTIPGRCTIDGDVTRCWCGTNSTTCLSNQAAANGPCRNAVVAAAKSTDPATIKLRFADPNFPLGRAVNLSGCRGAFCGVECGPPPAPPTDCSDPTVPNGTSCNDAQACTVLDACQDGVCVGEPVADGTACDDSNMCTYQDSCQFGTCMGTWVPGCVPMPGAL